MKKIGGAQQSLLASKELSTGCRDKLHLHFCWRVAQCDA